ncbi:MAG: SpoIIE family protein phosphatase, partial [Gammaproteobacteria bacterium]|nr:SpoIIE family protein phosphatase [Gammaproteobacteria bacterium]
MVRVQTISIRQSLLRNLVLIIIVLAGGIAAITEYGRRQLVLTLSRSIIDHTLDFTEARLREFFGPVPAALQTARGWAESGLLDDMDTGAFNRLLRPVMEQFPQIASIRVADGKGREYMLAHGGKGWSNREVRADARGSQARWFEAGAVPDGNAGWESSPYDPRQRPWYQSALAAMRGGGTKNGAAWTEPYRLPGGATGITASAAAGDGEKRRVIALDIRLESVSAFTSVLKVSERGGVVVLTEDARIIGAPSNFLAMKDLSLEDVLLRRPAEIGWTLASDAARVLRDTGPDALPVRFESDDTAYWGQSRRFPLSAGHFLFIAVVVPEADLLGALPRLRVWLLAIAAVVILLAVLQAFVLSRRYSTPIEDLVDESDRISRGDFEQREPLDTTVSEIQQLADAHDRMRTGLKSLMLLERDLKIARQIQQHTFPDRLPVLERYDIDAFSEPAQQTGGDSYDVVPRDRPGGKGEPVASAVMLLADATGHGIGPALTAVQVRAMLRVAVRMGGDLLTIARHLNEQLSADLFGGRFITAWLGEIDADRHRLSYFSAGQAPLIHYLAADGRVEILDADAPPFGVEETMCIERVSVRNLATGDIFAVISDGVFDAQDQSGERFGVERVLRIISDYAAESSGRILLELRKALA